MTAGPIAGKLGPIGVWGHLDSLAIDDLRAYAARVEALGYGALWVPETVGREPFTLLGLLAAGTTRMVLGTSIASIYARDAVTTKLAAMTLHEATGGRFVLGLGVSHPHLVTRLRGHEYSRPVGAMHEHLAAYHDAPYMGPLPTGTSGHGPPILVAALRERMLRLAAREADGAFPYLVSAERLAWMRGIVDDEATTVGRSRPLLLVTLPVAFAAEPAQGRDAARAYLAPYLRTPTYRASWSAQGLTEDDWEKPGSDRLVEMMVATGDAAAIHRRVAGLRDAGADHVALIPLASDGTTEHLSTLEALAGAAILRA